MAVEQLLDRLDKVKPNGPGKWNARCPAHEDRSPSLAIKDEDGIILLHCFAGCAVEDILGAIGLEMTELFPPNDRPQAEKPVRFGVPFSARDALQCLAYEGGVLCILAADMADGRVLSPDEQDRLVKAAGRLSVAASYVGI